MSDSPTRIRNLSPKRLMLLALDQQSKLEELERRRTEPIAIVGMGCRFPGAEGGPEDFWRLLELGTSAIAEVPKDRWDVDAYYDPDVDSPGRMATKWGAFLSRIDEFDAPFFSIAGREANSIDPQHRMLLEVCWEALEHAGHSPREFKGTATGVFVGICASDYQTMLLARGEETIDSYLASGTASSIAAGRISYALGLQGPSIAVDTACSASLVALHLACQSLRLDECRQALAGGVNIILSPKTTIALSKAHMMAPDGRCKAFDARADGFVRGEGCGVVVVKRLSDAQADGDHVLAVIRGSAVNQDGRSSGITAPNGVAQEALIRTALAQAGVRPEEVGYVEAHGTGTSLGDPIEAHALAHVLGSGRDKENPLVIGSVKTNVGHLEAAAGIAGLIKAVLVLQHEQIPAHLHFQQMNPHIDWGGVPVEIPLRARPWPRGNRRRVAGVSSFGFSGTNAHVILEEAPEPPIRPPASERPLHLLALSARSESALRALGGRYVQVLENCPFPVGDLCFTANAGRPHFEHRLAVTGSSFGQLRDALLKALPGRRVLDREGIRPVFLFPGQGAQYAGMGKQLFDTQPVFRAAIDECAALLREELEIPLLDVLWGGSTEQLDQTAYSQPGLFAIEYALAVLWRSWGIEPAVVLGHSVGEYVAACVAGVYSLADGLKLIARRGRLMQAVAGNGAMAAVHAPEDRVREALRGLEQRVAIAAINGPESLVISGYEQELHIAEQRLMDTGVTVQRLNVSHAFHSPQMRAMEEAFEAAVREIRFQPPRLRLISSVTGRAVTRDEMSQAAYWRRQVSEPVRFGQAMETLRESGDAVFLEVGPGATLTGLGQQCIDTPQSLWLASLRRKREEWPQLLDTLAQLYARGADVNWVAFDQPYAPRRVPLPTYPFQRQRYWLEASSTPKTSLSTAQTAQQVKPTTEAELSEWFYRIAWQESTVRTIIVEKLCQHWIVLPDVSGVAEALASKIQTAGCSCEFANDSAELERMVSRSAPRHSEIVDLRYLDATVASADEPCQILATLVQSLARMNRPGLRVWVVTRAAQSTGREAAPVLPWQAPVWALGRTIAFEHSEFWGGLIDLDPVGDHLQNANLLWEHLISPDAEDQVALRNGCRLVSRLERSLPAAHPFDPLFRSDAAYLITGGFGGLGLEIARWMVGHGARRLILMGRTPLPPRSTWSTIADEDPASRAISMILQMEKLGVTIRSAFVDIGDEPAMRSFFRHYEEDCQPPIRGVIHAAGAVRQTLVSDSTAEDFRELFKAKVDGTWLLHDILKHEPLDFLVFFSSASAVLSSPRLGPYAASNAFLDAMADYRTSAGLPALSINWGVWSDAGMAARSESSMARKVSERGMGGMRTAEGLHCLGRLIGNAKGQVCVMPVDWGRWTALYPAYMSKPFFSSLRNCAEAISDQTRSAVGRVAERESEPQILQLLNMSPDERKERLVQYLSETLAVILGVAVDTVDPSHPITDFGLDSLMALEFRNRINSEFRVMIPTVHLLQGPCLEELAGRLAAELPEPKMQAPAAQIADSAFEFPLSFGQQEHWFGHKIMPGSAAFNIAFSVKASPAIEWSAFERAVAKLTSRHSALRTVIFESDAGVPMQRVLSEVHPDVTIIDASSWSEESVKEAILQDFQRPLNLDRPMFCASVFRCSDHDVLFFKVDHIIIDHWSARVCLEDLRKFYSAEINEREAELEPIEAEYRNFVDWEMDAVKGEGSEALWAYWKQKLGGELPILRLHSLNDRPATLMAEGRALSLTFDQDLWAQAQRIAREHRATGYSFLLAAFQVLLYRYTGQEDIIVGTSSSGREDPRWENMIGLFINLLPLRADLSGNPTFADYLDRTRDTVLGALDHQAFPYSLLVTRLRPPRTPERNPVFQSFFNFLTDRSGVMGVLFEGVGGSELDFGRSTLRPHMAMTLQEVRGSRTMIAMNRPEVTMQLAEIQGRLMGYLNFNRDALETGIAAAMAADYCKLLNAIVRNPNAQIKDLLQDPLRVASEREEIVL
jgi:acyl transferase domain-containing protein/acyl carrier protein